MAPTTHSPLSAAGAQPNRAGRARLVRDGDDTRLQLSGDWTLPHYERLEADIASLESVPDRVDFSDQTELDTAGATLLLGLLGAKRLAAVAGNAPDLPPARRALLRAVADAVADRQPRSSPEGNRWLESVARLGLLAERGWQNGRLLLGFIGLTLSTLAATFWRPRRWRYTALVVQVHQTGLNALPIVALLTFMVGAVVAFLGATVLSSFGATIYTIDLVAYSFLREFGVLLTAILLAGRTASAFTAQLGSMKVNEELDALRALALSPMEMLVLPRVLALLITLPLLTFVAMISGLLGGAAVSLFSLDISPIRYLAAVQEVPVRHYLVGLSKAPIFAFLIAVIGCLEGFKVEGSALSVGSHTTSSVVQSIFVVILVDAVAAIFFMEMGW